MRRARRPVSSPPSSPRPPPAPRSRSAPDTVGPGHQPGRPAAGDQGHRHPHARSRSRACRTRSACSTARPSSAAADHRPRRGAEQHPRRGGRQPLQLLARPADLDPRLRQPLQLRRARAQDPARRHPADAARRPEPAHQRRLRRHRAGRGAARRQLVALRQRLGRRDRASDRARRAGAVRAAGAGAGRQRQARRRRVLQVAELDLGPLGQRERHALGLASSRPTASGSTARPSSASSTPASTTRSAARPSARCG